MSIIDSHHSYAWYIRPLLALMSRRRSGLSEPVRLWARQPMAFFGFLLMNRALDHGNPSLSKTLRALVRTRVSQLNGCRFCIDLNAARALDCGLSREKLEALAWFSDSSLYSDAEKVALAYAETVTTLGNVADASLIEQLRHTFDDDSIVALTALIAHQNMSAKFNAALGASPQELCMTHYGYLPSD
ncbi:carboxymuconolactone decarboxylase family protein [Methylomonas sp. LW13]|uniref:carboxymuconolactone decarboxylase family protein n=1 Tax=unclassified Methylomonas TaxID=2608980 RepID=UPI00051B95CD|nr:MULTISPECIES: carboxymuconolactone decarboxylase family protein [unclassified Methylomonas]PKD39649.1 carboxymuconolactone decarboxylase family protein [Methylomonas sp. Kb3]QBC27744.1 carboxymuconolactone decarboxylase family protein [Methylomonas sp. LW13]